MRACGPETDVYVARILTSGVESTVDLLGRFVDTAEKHWAAWEVSPSEH